MLQKYFLVLAMLGMNGHLAAQDTTKAQQLEEVVVTASKYPQKISATGKVISVITREQIEQNGGKDLSQLLNEQAGIYVNGANSNPGKDKSIYLRGARIDHTLIAIDGLPVYDPSGIGGNFDIRNIAPEQIERIEILKGSQSTLYGSDAMAGVINFITRKSVQRPLQVQGAISLGSYRTRNSTASMEGSIGKISYRTGWGMLSSEGLDETLKETSNNESDKDGYSQKSVFAEFGVKPSSYTEIRTFFRRTSLKGALDQGAFTDELDYTYRQHSWQAGLRARWEGKNHTMYFLYQYNDIARVYTDDSIKSRNGFDIYSNGTYQGGEHFLDLYAPVKLSDKLKWTIGSDYRLSQSSQYFSSISDFGTYSSSYSRDSLHQQQWSAYTSLHYSSSKNWNIEVGGRMHRHSTYGYTPVFNINPSLLLLHNRLKFFGNISSGYRTPSLFQLFSEYGNPVLRPERAVTAELGIQYRHPFKNLRWSLTGFQRSTRDVIFFSFDPINYRQQYINQDQQRDHGVEFELSLQPTSRLFLRTSYNYVAGKISTFTAGKDTTYDNLLRRPRHSANLFLTCQVSKQLSVSTVLQYNSSRKDLYFDLSAFEQKPVTLKPFALWDVNAEYVVMRSVKIFLNLRNITNTSYTEAAGFRTLGRNGHLGFRFHF